MPPKPQAKPSPAVNHARQNRQQILEQQALNRERVKQDEYDADRKRALIERQKAQYAHAGPKVGQAPREEDSAPGVQDDVRIDVYVRECDPDRTSYSQLESALKQAAERQQAARQQPQQQRQQAAPAHQAAPAAHYQQQQPAALARETPQGRQGSGGRAPPSGGGSAALGLRRPSSTNDGQQSTVGGGARGQVPEYLRQRKAELEAEKSEARRIADIRAEQSKYPPGHRPVSEEERAEILARLATRRSELEGDLGKLPMRFDTQAIRQRRGQIETELQEVEAAERKFSVKKQLFVPL
jgi:hypothetical protein